MPAADEQRQADAQDGTESPRYRIVVLAMLDGRWMVRISIGALATEREHVAALWNLLRAEAIGA